MRKVWRWWGPFYVWLIRPNPWVYSLWHNKGRSPLERESDFRRKLNVARPGEPHRCLSPSVYRLYRVGVNIRWGVVALLWLTVIPWSVWQFQGDIGLLRDHFTWAGLRYALAFQLGPTFTLFLGVGVTGAVLVRQSCHLLWGLSRKEQKALMRDVAKIRKAGPRHPFWKWVFVR